MHKTRFNSHSGIRTTGLLGFSVFIIWLISGCGSKKPLPTVEKVDLERYQGTWYDIAHLPQKFQEGCKCVTAEYTLMDGYVKVVNTCVDEETGEVSKAKGKAFPVSNSQNSRLKVQFFWPFKGDYYIIALEDDYSYAMVGSPDRKYLWILGREPEPAAIIIKKYLNKAEKLGFDTSALVYTDQECYVEPIQEES